MTADAALRFEGDATLSLHSVEIVGGLQDDSFALSWRSAEATTVERTWTSTGAVIEGSRDDPRVRTVSLGPASVVGSSCHDTGCKSLWSAFSGAPAASFQGQLSASNFFAQTAMSHHVGSTSPSDPLSVHVAWPVGTFVISGSECHETCTLEFFGDLEVAFEEGQILFEDDQGSLMSLSASTRSQDARGPLGGLGLGRERVVEHIRVRMHDAHLALHVGDGWFVGASAVDGRLHGSSEWPNVHEARLETDAVQIVEAHVPVFISGSLTWSRAPEPASHRIGGTFSYAQVGGTVLIPPPGPPLYEASAWWAAALATILSAVAWFARGGFFGRFYTRIARGEASEMPIRRQIVAALERSPSCNASDLARAIGLSRSGVRHHLRFLVRDGVVLDVFHAGERLYVLKHKWDSASHELVLRDATRRRIHDALAKVAPGSLTQSDLAAMLLLHRRLVSHHLKILVDAELVASEGKNLKTYRLVTHTTALREASGEASRSSVKAADSSA